MGKYTENLNLYKVDTSLNESGEIVDGNECFNIDRMLNENWDKIDASLKPNRNIGELVWSMDPLVDAALHLLDGAVLEYGAYSAFIDSRAELLLTNPECFTTESDWQEKVAQYGVCGKYVFDSIAKTLRLPKITGFIQGTLDPSALGEITEAGLPNIKGEIRSSNFSWGDATGNGAFKSFSSGGSASGGASSDNKGFKFDASTYSTIYKDNFNKVQPQAINGYVYMVVATSTKTDVQINIDNVMTDLNAKADKDLNNCTRPYIIETWQNGTSFGELWSNGMLVQRFHVLFTGNPWTVDLVKAYKDTNYNVAFGQGNSARFVSWTSKQIDKITFSYSSVGDYGTANADVTVVGYSK